MAEPIRDFLSTDDGEWDVSGGQFHSVAGAEAVPQGIRIRLGMFLGECYLNEDEGVDYIDQILIKNPDQIVVRSLLSEAIADTPDVTNVQGAQLQLADDGSREASIQYVADTVYAEEPITAEVTVG